MKLVIENKEYETKDEWYRLTFSAKADYIYEPPVMYYKDGSGYPGCEELEIEEVKITDFEIYNPATRDYEPFKPVKEQVAEWEEEIEEYLQDADLEEWDNYGE